jgi:hypothetical protein
MTFITGMLVGYLLPKGIRFMRAHPDRMRDGMRTMKRAIGR